MWFVDRCTFHIGACGSSFSVGASGREIAGAPRLLNCCMINDLFCWVFCISLVLVRCVLGCPLVVQISVRFVSQFGHQKTTMTAPMPTQQAHA